MARLIGIWQMRFVKPEDVDPGTDEVLPEPEMYELKRRFSEILSYTVPPKGMTYDSLAKAKEKAQACCFTHERTVAIRRKVS